MGHAVETVQRSAAAHYRVKAEGMLRLAEQTTFPDTRQAYFDLARNWSALADFHEAKRAVADQDT